MRKFGLIGKHLSHSFSKDFFTLKFENEGLDACYENIELNTITEFKEFIQSGEYDGFNVTIPYKIEILPFLDEWTEEVKEIGAVNTVAIKNGKLKGYNTDAFGFHQSIKPFLKNKHERALILGTGGAAKAVAFVFKSIGVDVLSVSRNPKGSKEFYASQINKHMLNACKVVVNCTPVGMFPDIDACPDFPFEFLTAEHLCIDLIYNPEETVFLRKSAQQGATVLNGKSMLIEQALKSWEIWNQK